MIKKYFIRIKDYLLHFNLKKDNKPLIFLICLLIATAVWFMNSLGNEYETDVRMPVQYTGLPKNKVLINKPPDHFEVRINAIGSLLFRSKLRWAINSLNFNIRAFTNGMMTNGNVSTYRINPNDYKDQFKKQIDPEIKIIDIDPDSIVFQFDNIVEKKIAVVDDFEMNFEKQYYQSDKLIFTPDSVLVTGPSLILDTLSGIKTKHTTFKKVTNTVERNVSLQEIDQLEIEPRRVNVHLPVSHFTEYTNKIDITVANLPDSLSLITFPGKIEVTCLVSLEDYHQLTPGNFVIGVDYEDIIEGINVLPVSLIRAPEKLKNLKFHPHEVEYLIKRK